MSEGGYVRLHRSLLGHPAFRNDGEAMAFAWLIARASWKRARVRYKGQAITLERGQLAISIRDLADALDRPKGWVERLFARLKSETMVQTRSETGVTIVTICKYAEYQAEQDSGRTPPETPPGTATGQRQDTEQRREEGKKEEYVDGGLARAREAANDLPIPTDLIELTAELCRIAGIRHVDPGAILRHQQTVQRWLADGFQPPTDIVPVIRQAITDTTERISSLAYFDTPIRQARARTEAKRNGHEPRQRTERQGLGRTSLAAISAFGLDRPDAGTATG